MLAETIPEFYDFEGKRTLQPRKKFYPHFKGRPMGSFLSQPLKMACHDMDEVRAFLKTCRYISDQEQFGVKDHWMPPEEFEQVRRGDCDDFALWTWRQLLALGYHVRFVAGRAGRYGEGHAWLTLRIEDRTYVVEPLLARFSSFPRLSTFHYIPAISVEAAGDQVKYFEHSKRRAEPPISISARLVPEWLLFEIRLLPRLAQWPFYALRALYRRKRKPR